MMTIDGRAVYYSTCDLLTVSACIFGFICPLPCCELFYIRTRNVACFSIYVPQIKAGNVWHSNNRGCLARCASRCSSVCPMHCTANCKWQDMDVICVLSPKMRLHKRSSFRVLSKSHSYFCHWWCTFRGTSAIFGSPGTRMYYTYI
jgi:hypothetical protein